MSTLARAAAATASGLLLTAAFPPGDQGWLAFPALVPLCLSLRGASGRSGALAGACFGVAFLGIHWYWISYVGWLAWVALTVAEAAFLAAFGALAARVSGTLAGRVLGWPALWAGLEMMRARWPAGGFTWGDLGYSQAGGGPVLPVARLGGVYLLGAVVLAVSALVAEAAAGRGMRSRLAPLAAAAVLVLAPAPFPLGGDGGALLDVAAVQGNVPRERFTGIGRRGGRVGPEDLVIIRNHLAVTERLLKPIHAGEPRPGLVIWPENSFDRDPRQSALLDTMREAVNLLGAPFLVGAILDVPDGFVNANLVMEPGAPELITQRYDKVHLVPFGEYVPYGFFRRIVPVLDREIPQDGVAGERPVVFDVGAARVGSLICFESSYPELARTLVRDGSRVLVVTTNNATFGTSPLARQHLAASRMRAVELDRWVVHAAIAGVSAIVRPDGSVSQEAGLFVPALLRERVPLRDTRTPYARYGSWIEAVLGAGALAVAAAAVRRRRRAEGSS